MESVTTGLSQGDFHRLAIWYNGAMTDIATLVGAGAGVTDVTSQSSELSVATSGTTRQLTLNLGTYVTNAAVSSLLANYVGVLVCCSLD